ncbi:MAG: retroviral-like aspartic protease family protein [Alphaproteobacteria bacterium]|nr:retroviral-like aspartic protease family protein [Alphaproteobacteria bacterium]
MADIKLLFRTIAVAALGLVAAACTAPSANDVAEPQTAMMMQLTANTKSEGFFAGFPDAFFVVGKVNNKAPMGMLVDTGSTAGLTVSDQDLDKLGIPPEQIMRRGTIHTPIGEAGSSAPVFHLDLQIGGCELKDVSGAAVPGEVRANFPSGMALLGTDALRRLSIYMRGDQMTLSCEGNKQEQFPPSDFSRRKFVFPITANNQPLQALFDTGAAVLIVSDQDLGQLGVKPAQIIAQGRAVFLSGIASMGPVFPLNLQLGVGAHKCELKNIRAMAAHLPSGTALFGRSAQRPLDIRMQGDRMTLSC